MEQTESDIAATLKIGESQWWQAGWVKVLGLVAVIAAGAAYWMVSGARQEQVEYVTAEAAIASFRVTVTATGTVEPTNLVEISSELSGTLANVFVDYNDRVEVGTVLAELDTVKLDAQLAVSKAALDSAIARVAMAQATLDEAKERYETALSLEGRGITSRQDFVAQRAAYIRAQSELQSARADRALAEASLDLQQAERDKACICSPIKGVVLDRAADAGQIVASSLSAPILFTVAEDLSKMELRVDVDEADIGQIAVGNSAEFTVDAYDEERFPAEIAEIRFAPETVEGVVTYKAILTIDNSDMRLRPGMTATADIVVARLSDVLSVPNAAIRYTPPVAPGEKQERSGLLGMLIPSAGNDPQSGNAKTLWVLRNGVPQEIAIRAGASDGRLTQILEGGLAPGDLVITDRIDG
ncbi:efflux RND transporter periplasmic adaptor subunit [Roseovarius sp.]|uniref:efflux RND transporter periplasmic adaptor subunit n=1 Tax=Roseovarius sp. TaxID=1486281 RepID=UPI0025E5E673|nr:efflux RND transporter periplasmic adaptor subunit [Roseovarius sp.]